MPLNPEIKKVLVIGSGPIVIGQAAEFDYAGTQACRALKEEGLSVVLVNSNPATIMTDANMADAVYIEPLTTDVIKKIIEIEKPDSLLGTLGGQTGLNLSMELAGEGYLAERGIKLLGANPETIDMAENRESFKKMLERIGQPSIPSGVVTTSEGALRLAEEIGYPVIVRPAFTLGGSGGGIARNPEKLREIAKNGLRLSPIRQVLIEKDISGWKEIEFEVMRDGSGNVITVCSMENFDPVGIHTGDSIVVAPALTLSDKEYQMLRTASLRIITELKIEGGCNIQFALYPHSFDYAVIEVNPRVSRSSALASKATGYPIAKIAAKIAVGYRLNEIRNSITKKTNSCFEPALDYVVVKMPKWPFDKFIYADRKLGTQMKATGEVMAIGATFPEALMKAVRGAEISMSTLNLPALGDKTDDEIRAALGSKNDTRLFTVFEAVKRGFTYKEINDITKIDPYFLGKLKDLVNMENKLKAVDTEFVPDSLYLAAKKSGYPDADILKISGAKIREKLYANYKTVDTCAAEFAAETPYFYASYDDVNEAADYIDHHNHTSKRVIVFGSGPIRIGQGIEFDYSSVHCVWAFKKLGYEVAIVNNNPETVSTDFDISDRLYFDPLTGEDVMNVIQTEKPEAVIVAYGGQTAIKLTKFLHLNNIKIFGSSAESIDLAEDREKFDHVLSECGIPRPDGRTARTLAEALGAARELGFPILLRPSYVIGGQNMVLAYSEDTVENYMNLILSQDIDSPVLIDKYLQGIEAEVDAICDGTDILIPGVMEHVERAGIHSGDSMAMYPAKTLSGRIVDTLVEYTRRLASSLRSIGLLNVQYVIYNDKVYVIEANPRASRTVPYISKVTGLNMVEIASRVILGEKLKDMPYGTGLYKKSKYVAVKVPVFSFEKMKGVDVQLGPEMKSTGEVLGIDRDFETALYKGLLAAGYSMQSDGGILITVQKSDLAEMLPIARKFKQLGFRIYATDGNLRFLEQNGVKAEFVAKIADSDENTLTLIESGRVQYVFSTSELHQTAYKDSIKMRRKAVEMRIPCLTGIDTATTLADCLLSREKYEDFVPLDIVKMHGGSD
ncbi:carbamoyl-phosphate synthase (glutamine-hydrolyzing) [Clostridia bacterium]|nr:carbamoyl-phosphate synthase (glutamine-hydrolyzing) [Clostridia bacterium]